jgi:hypothetical protein
MRAKMDSHQTLGSFLAHWYYRNRLNKLIVKVGIPLAPMLFLFSLPFFLRPPYISASPYLYILGGIATILIALSQTGTTILDQTELEGCRNLVQEKTKQIDDLTATNTSLTRDLIKTSFLNSYLTKIVTFKAKCYLHSLEALKDFFERTGISSENFKEARKLLINKIEDQEHYSGNLFRIINLMAEYFHHAFFNGNPAALVNVLFYTPISDGELQIIAWYKKVHYREIKFKKDQISSVSTAWREKTLQVIDVPKQVGIKCTILDNRHAQDFKNCITYPIIDIDNREATKDDVLGVLQVYSNQEGIFIDAPRERILYENILSSFSERIRYEALRKTFKNKLNDMI